MQNSGKHPPPSLYFVIIVLILIGVLGPFISEEFTVPFLSVAATGIVFAAVWLAFDLYVRYTRHRAAAEERLSSQASPPPPNSSRPRPIETLPPAGTSPAASLHELRSRYLSLMIDDWRVLRLQGLDPEAADPRRAAPLTLEQVYVALETTTPRPEQLRRRTKQDREEPLTFWSWPVRHCF